MCPRRLLRDTGQFKVLRVVLRPSVVKAAAEGKRGAPRGLRGYIKL